MKIQKTEFKAIIKECLKELISEGALNHMFTNIIAERSNLMPQQQLNPQMRMAIQAAAGGNPIMEQIYADTAITSLYQQQNNIMPNGQPLPAGVNLTMFESQQPQMQPMQNGFTPTPPRNPLPPRELQQQQGQAQQSVSTWARLAFNSPISNRPGGPRGSEGTHLPGSKKGSFE